MTLEIREYRRQGGGQGNPHRDRPLCATGRRFGDGAHGRYHVVLLCHHGVAAPGTGFLSLERRLRRKDVCRRSSTRRVFQARRPPVGRRHSYPPVSLIGPCAHLFPKNMRNEVQVILISLSHDKEHHVDMLGVIAASTALVISDIPWNGPVAGARVGLVDGAVVRESHLYRNAGQPIGPARFRHGRGHQYGRMQCRSGGRGYDAGGALPGA